MKEEEKRLREEVKKGKIEAALQLARGLHWGVFGAADPVRAAAMYRYCCRSGKDEVVSQAYYQLGNLYYYGFLKKENEEDGRQYVRAFSCFLKSAMKKDNPRALRRLGDMYRYGQGVKADRAVSLALYLKANEKEEICPGTTKG